MSNREKILEAIKRRQEKDVFIDLEPEKLKIIQEALKTSRGSLQETLESKVIKNADITIPQGQHRYVQLIDAYMVKYQISKVDAIQRVMREHSAVHRDYIESENRKN